jgi:large subunit ribosomal protein L29
MKQKEISQLSASELKDRLAEEKGQLVKLQLNHSVSPIENPLKIRGVRRTIARLNTELTKRSKQDSK